MTRSLIVSRLAFCAVISLMNFGVSGKAATASPLFSRGYTVIPEPQQVDLKGGDFEFGIGWRLELGSGVNADDVAVESLKEGLASRYGVTLETEGRGRAQGRVISLAMQPGSVEVGAAIDKNKASLEEQVYKLELAGSGIRITANAPTGLFYGVETLVQLVKRAEGKLWLPEAEITDWPDLELRNIYYDNYHHLEHVDVLKGVLRQAAFYKINGFVFRPNGHFEYGSAPVVVEPYAISPEQLQELTNYGLRYHIQLIPYLDAPAHIEFILKHPEYASLREYPDSDYELCTTNPDSYKLLDGMYQNLLDANKGVKYFLLSTDEAYYVGLADNAQCHEGQREKELGSVGKALAAFLDKAAGYLHDRGRTVFFWGEYPLKPEDIPSLPPYLASGEVYGPAFDRAFKAHGMQQMIHAYAAGGESANFPNYYARILMPSEHAVNSAAEMYPRGKSRIEDLYDMISFTSARQDADLMGSFMQATGNSGTNPETFWLGYVTGSSWAWHPGSPNPDEAMSSFYHLFYGQGAMDMGRVYQLMSTQAEFWNGSWDSEPSTARKPIFGNSDEVYKVRQPAHDQTLPLPPVPEGEYLRLPFDWGMENNQRVKMAEGAMPALDELFDLLRQNLRSVQFNRYNLEVFLSVAGLYRQNLQMLEEMGEIDSALKVAQAAAAHVQYAQAVASLDRALDIAQHIRYQRNVALHEAVDTWYKSWYPRVAEANGRKFLNEVDDVKDHLPMRTVDMSYLVYRELILPFGQWFEQVENARNHYAQAHNIPERTDKLDWSDYKAVNHFREEPVLE